MKDPAMMTSPKSDEKGIALVFTLFLMASLSALAVSLMFLSQTETSSTRNYRTMSQARYAGEAGAHKAVNHLINSYTIPGSFTSYNLTTSPVTCTSGCATTGPVVLSGIAGVSSNYPDATVASAFATAVQGTLATNIDGVLTNGGLGTVSYGASATLMAMRSVSVYGGGTGVIQIWEITATGTVPGALPATVEVTAMLERESVSAKTYAIFATGAGCGAINLGGTTHTDSYNSTALVGGVPAITTGGGSVGTNGNLSISGNVTVNGNLDTPRTGVGSCSAGTPTALSAGGRADVAGSIVQLPQAKVFPDPLPPSPLPSSATSTQSLGASAVTCTVILAANSLVNPPGCSYSGSTLTLTSNGSTPILLGNASVNSNTTLNVVYGTSCVSCTPTAGTGTALLNVNSFKVGSNATFTVGSNTSVTMNIAGTSLPSGVEPLDFHAGGFANTSYDPSKLQILYAGTGTIEMIGGPNAVATIYAPNAAVIMQGNADFYGSVLSNSYNAQGNASVHYDTALSSKFVTLGNFVMTSFSWKKY